MSKNLLVLVGILIVVAAGIYLYQTNQTAMTPKEEKMMMSASPYPEDTMLKEDSTMMEDDGMMKEEQMESDDKMMKQSSRYLPYTTTVLGSTSSTRRVLYFYASWCPTCIPADADFKKNASTFPDDLTVIRVNYNDPDTDADEKALAVKYDITYQHTFVQIDAAGEVLTKWNGGSTKELLAKVK